MEKDLNNGKRFKQGERSRSPRTRPQRGVAPMKLSFYTEDTMDKTRNVVRLIYINIWKKER